jgi:hypothetical protein
LFLCVRWLGVRDSDQKFFASFFQKRSAFLTYLKKHFEGGYLPLRIA